MPLELWNEICDMLDTKRDLDFKDFRMLGEAVGVSKHEINLLDNQRMHKSPTEVILRDKFSTGKDATVGRLGQILLQIDRSDVAQIVDDWVESESKKGRLSL